MDARKATSSIGTLAGNQDVSGCHVQPCNRSFRVTSNSALQAATQVGQAPLFRAVSFRVTENSALQNKPVSDEWASRSVRHDD